MIKRIKNPSYVVKEAKRRVLMDTTLRIVFFKNGNFGIATIDEWSELAFEAESCFVVKMERSEVIVRKVTKINIPLKD